MQNASQIAKMWRGGYWLLLCWLLAGCWLAPGWLLAGNCLAATGCGCWPLAGWMLDTTHMYCCI